MTILDAVFVFIAAALGFILGAMLTNASWQDDCYECRQEMQDVQEEDIITNGEDICDICGKKDKIIFFGDYKICLKCCAAFTIDYFNVLYKDDAHKMFAYMTQVKDLKKKIEKGDEEI